MGYKNMIFRRLGRFGIMLVFVAGTIVGFWTATMTTNYSKETLPMTKKIHQMASSSGCVRRVHIFGSEDIMKHIPELSSFVNLFLASELPLGETMIDCRSEGYKCDVALTMGIDVNTMKDKDAVVFGFVPTQFRGEEGRAILNEVLKTSPSRGQIWIYFSTETPLRVLRWTADLNFGRLKYHLLMTYDRDSDIVLPFGYFEPFNNTHNDEHKLRKDMGVMAWVASNCRGFWPRMPVVERLQQMLPLDTYGKCGEKKCLPKRSAQCNDLIARYKFYLATPNSECRDYITEKFWMMSLKGGAVPVVMGAKKENYERVAPPGSYIHAADFKNLEDLTEYIKLLDGVDDEYQKYYDWRREGQIILTFPTKPKVFCQTLPYLMSKEKHLEFKYLSDSPWYKGCRVAPDRTTFDLTKDEEKKFFDLDNWSIWR